MRLKSDLVAMQNAGFCASKALVIHKFARKRCDCEPENTGKHWETPGVNHKFTSGKNKLLVLKMRLKRGDTVV